jgi:hypothetical protein
MPFPRELRHLTAQLCSTIVEADESIDADEDLLARGSSSFWVSDSPWAAGLEITLGVRRFLFIM